MVKSVSTPAEKNVVSSPKAPATAPKISGPATRPAPKTKRAALKPVDVR